MPGVGGGENQAALRDRQDGLEGPRLRPQQLTLRPVRCGTREEVGHLTELDHLPVYGLRARESCQTSHQFRVRFATARSRKGQRDHASLCALLLPIRIIVTIIIIITVVMIIIKVRVRHFASIAGFLFLGDSIFRFSSSSHTWLEMWRPSVDLEESLFCTSIAPAAVATSSTSPGSLDPSGACGLWFWAGSCLDPCWPGRTAASWSPTALAAALFSDSVSTSLPLRRFRGEPCFSVSSIGRAPGFDRFRLALGWPRLPRFSMSAKGTLCCGVTPLSVSTKSSKKRGCRTRRPRECISVASCGLTNSAATPLSRERSST
eukprot:scaffold859_cov306-Pinguiococcus_pyrenoidosus.AAC.8